MFLKTDTGKKEGKFLELRHSVCKVLYVPRNASFTGMSRCSELMGPGLTLCSSFSAHGLSIPQLECHGRRGSGTN